MSIAAGLVVEAVSIVLKTVLSRVVEEFKFTWGYKEEINKMKRKLILMQALLDAVNERKLTKIEQLWMGKVKDAAYYADDVFDKFSFEVLRRKMEVRSRLRSKARKIFTLSNQIGFRWLIKDDVKKFTLMVDDVFKEADLLGIKPVKLADENREAAYAAAEFQRRQEIVDTRQVVGRDRDEGYLVEVLCKSDKGKDFSAVAIVGMAGIGKTTLARRAFENGAVVKHFTERVWICVSENFNVNRLLNEMAESITTCKCDMSNTEAIIRKLQHHLQGRRYLLVLDDVWNTLQERWESLRTSLQRIGASSGSIVLVTTRTDDVIMIMGDPLIHRLEGLSHEDSWALFKQRVFSDETTYPSSFEAIGRKIVDKCKGVPLAIKMLSSLLQPKRNANVWESIANSEIWELPQDEYGIVPSLLLSFHHLPSSYVKQCFAYCSIFPKDATLLRQDLINLWMAQGFLCQSERSKVTMEEMGQEYFNILLNNSFLQVSKRDQVDEDIEECTMHDLVHDLAIFVSKHDWLIWKEGGETDDVSSIRHLAIFTKSSDLVSNSSLEEMSKRLRTVHSWVNVPTGLWMHMKYLRVLKLRRIGIEEVPAAIDELKHLRYLDLSENPIRQLPELITNLYSLQTLRLLGCNKLHELPIGLSKLINLRHIPTENHVLVPSGIERLTCLQTLPSLQLLEAGGWRIHELGCLNDVRGSLDIAGLCNLKSKGVAERAGIRRKAGISALRLDWSATERAEDSSLFDEEVLDVFQPHPNLKSLMVCHFNGGKFPLWLMRMTVVRENDERILLHNVMRIELIDCKRCQQLPTLGHLPFLRVLRIKGLESIKCIGTEFYTHNDCDDGVTSSSDSIHGSSSKALVLFPALRTLEICNFPNLTEWLEPPYPMGMTCTHPFLETLKIRDCPLLTTTPRNFPSLGHLEIQGIISSQPLHNIVIGSQEVILALYLLSLAFHCVPPSLHNQTLKTLSVSKVQELTYLPLFQHTSLEKLEIRDCGKLMCLPNGLENLVSLKTLEVRGCQLLITFPDISGLNSLRELTIANCHGLTWTPIGLESCTALEILKICECDNIDNVPDLKKLGRLEDVSIYDCGDQLTSLLKVGLHGMPHLSYLVIGGCKSKLDEEPEDFPDISPLLGIKSLRALGLVCWPKLKFLPEQLQHFTALGELGINSFDGSEVPEWIGGLLSLYALGFKECWNLKYLPSRSALLRLEKLRCLQIEDCPLLKERCAKDNGPEWHKICHIELVEIDGQPI